MNIGISLSKYINITKDSNPDRGYHCNDIKVIHCYHKSYYVYFFQYGIGKEIMKSLKM